MNTINPSKTGPLGVGWLGLTAAAIGPLVLGAYLVLHHGVSTGVAIRALLGVVLLCFVPGYLVQRGLFRLNGLNGLEGAASAGLLGLLVTPLVWYLMCWLGIAVAFWPLLAIASVAAMLLGLRSRSSHRATDPPWRVTLADTGILWLALGIAVVWSHSLSVVEVHDGRVHVMPYGDHAVHVAIVAELARHTPPEAVPFVSGATNKAYHYMPDVWCDLMRRVTGADAETAYFYIALTMRWVFVALGCYLSLVRRFGRGAALAGVACAFLVIGFPVPRGQHALLTNELPGFLHCSYPTAFGLVGVFLVVYYSSLIDSRRSRGPLLLAAIVSALLLWHKANFALAVVPAVTILAFLVLRQRGDWRWFILCFGVQVLLIVVRQGQLAEADFAYPLVMRPLAFLLWWWDSLRASPGWPTQVLQTVRAVIESLPVVLQWPLALLACMGHAFHLGLVAMVYFIVRRRHRIAQGSVHWADAVTLSILACTCIGFVFFPIAKGVPHDISAHLLTLVRALLFSGFGVMAYFAIRHLAKCRWHVTAATITLMVLGGIANADALRYSAVWKTRYRSEVLSEDVYACYRYIRASTPADAMVLQPQCQGWTTASMLTERRVVLERESHWRLRFDTVPILVDVRRFYHGGDATAARTILDRYGVDYVVADRSDGWAPPDDRLLRPVFRRGDTYVYEVADPGMPRPSAAAEPAPSHEAATLG
ncbi:MAG: hypothetical protein GY842_09080 [bacterium]|nr:hypothetical protein [bacterium]